MKKVDLTGIIAKEEGAEYSSLCLEINVASQGRTVSEARKMLLEAVILYLKTCLEEGISFLRPVSPDDNPLVSMPDKVKDKFKLVVTFSAKTSVKTASCEAL